MSLSILPSLMSSLADGLVVVAVGAREAEDRLRVVLVHQLDLGRALHLDDEYHERVVEVDQLQALARQQISLLDRPPVAGGHGDGALFRNLMLLGQAVERVDVLALRLERAVDHRRVVAGEAHTAVIVVADRLVHVESLADKAVGLLGRKAVGLHVGDDLMERLGGGQSVLMRDLAVREEAIAGGLIEILDAVLGGRAEIRDLLEAGREIGKISGIGDLPQGELARRQRTVNVRRGRGGRRLGATGQNSAAKTAVSNAASVAFIPESFMYVGSYGSQLHPCCNTLCPAGLKRQ